MKRSIGAHLLAILTALVAIIAVSALWIVNLRAGPKLDGWTAGATLLMIPLALLVLTVTWLVLRAIAERRKALGVFFVVVSTAAIGLVLTVINCGPVVCFQPGSPNYLAGWFVSLGLPAVALSHHFVLNALSRKSDNG